MNDYIEEGSIVDVVGLDYQNRGLILRQGAVVKDNQDGTFGVRVRSDANGFVVLENVHLADVQSAILY